MVVTDGIEGDGEDGALFSRSHAAAQVTFLRLSAWPDDLLQSSANPRLHFRAAGTLDHYPVSGEIIRRRDSDRYIGVSVPVGDSHSKLPPTMRVMIRVSQRAEAFIGGIMDSINPKWAT